MAEDDVKVNRAGRETTDDMHAAEQPGDNPVELFGMHVAHVGVNAATAEEAERIAERFSLLMGLPRVETPVSVFSDSLVETMKGDGRGKHGHIGFAVNDIAAAEAWFAARGFEVDESSRRLNPDGSTFLVYFKEEIGGFAIHLTQG